jgi:DNA-binding NarL/FixJ family response regulator
MDTHNGVQSGAECREAPLRGYGDLPVVLEERPATDESELPHPEIPDPAAWASPQEALPKLIYVDSRAFTRDCVGRWLQAHLGEFGVRPVADVEAVEHETIDPDEVRGVIINAGPERASSSAVVDLTARMGEMFPDVPIVVLSDHEDAENIREAFELGVRGYIPTSLASLVAVEAVRLVCAGGTFAPTAVLLSSWRTRAGADDAPLLAGFTQRQAQILGCLRRGMANKLIAYELNMCESTVKVHIRNIMKKLKATNRTQVVYLTNDFFEGNRHYQRA